MFIYLLDNRKANMYYDLGELLTPKYYMDEEIIIKEWEAFLERTPKDINWYQEFEKFSKTEPYKSAF